MDLPDFGEREPRLVDLAVVSALLYIGALIKGNAEVVLYGGELFVGHFYGSSHKHVHLVFLDVVKPFQGLLVKHRCLDHRAVAVNQVNCEDLPFTSFVLVGSQSCRLLNDSRFNPPVLAELVEELDRHEVVLVFLLCYDLALNPIVSLTAHIFGVNLICFAIHR